MSTLVRTAAALLAGAGTALSLAACTVVARDPAPQQPVVVAPQPQPTTVVTTPMAAPPPTTVTVRPNY